MLLNSHILVILVLTFYIAHFKGRNVFLSNKTSCWIPPGYYCPTGSSAPVDCPAGQYSNTTRSTSCLACPEGHYCPLHTSEPLPCPQGYYCGASTSIATTNPCPVGTYNNETGMNSVADCLDCWPGYDWLFVLFLKKKNCCFLTCACNKIKWNSKSFWLVEFQWKWEQYLLPTKLLTILLLQCLYFIFLVTTEPLTFFKLLMIICNAGGKGECNCLVSIIKTISNCNAIESGSPLLGFKF